MGREKRSERALFLAWGKGIVWFENLLEEESF